MRRTAGSFLCAASLLASATPSPSPSSIAYAAPEYRALWVDALHDGIRSDLAGGLPRQPYSDGISTPAGLEQRAHAFNSWFITQLTQPDHYRDVQLGWVATQPVFTMPALVPALQPAGAQ